MSVDNFIAALANEGCGEHLEYDAEFLELGGLKEQVQHLM
jgi:type VI secretion system protein ImpA